MNFWSRMEHLAHLSHIMLADRRDTLYLPKKLTDKSTKVVSS